MYSPIEVGPDFVSFHTDVSGDKRTVPFSSIAFVETPRAFD
jgi:hypothetical protein